MKAALTLRALPDRSFCSCVLPTFSMKALSMLIVFLKIPSLITLTFLTHLTLVLMLVQFLQTVFLPFSMPCRFYQKVDTMCTG